VSFVTAMVAGGKSQVGVGDPLSGTKVLSLTVALVRVTLVRIGSHRRQDER
jgi:hypothetical protein